MQFKKLVVESYKTEIIKKLRRRGYNEDAAKRFVEMSIDHPIEELIEEILVDEKQLSRQEVISFMRMIQKAKGVDELLDKSSKRSEGQKTMNVGGKEIKLIEGSKLTKKISSQFIKDDIEVKIPQHQMSALKMVLGTTPRIIVDLDKIPYIREIRFDVKDIAGEASRLVQQFRVIPITNQNNEYYGIVEVIIDPQLYSECLSRAEEEESKK